MSPFMTNYGDAKVLVPSDTVNDGFTSLYVGGAGNITLVTESGKTVLFTAVPVGTILPVRGSRVNSTATTATLLIGLN